MDTKYFGNIDNKLHYGLHSLENYGTKTFSSLSII